jgi:hypothetical protein
LKTSNIVWTSMRRLEQSDPSVHPSQVLLLQQSDVIVVYFWTHCFVIFSVFGVSVWATALGRMLFQEPKAPGLSPGLLGQEEGVWFTNSVWRRRDDTATPLDGALGIVTSHSDEGLRLRKIWCIGMLVLGSVFSYSSWCGDVMCVWNCHCVPHPNLSTFD